MEEFHDLNGIILMLLVITLNPVKNAISLKMIFVGQFIFLVLCTWNSVFGNDPYRSKS